MFNYSWENIKTFFSLYFYIKPNQNFYFHNWFHSFHQCSKFFLLSLDHKQNPHFNYLTCTLHISWFHQINIFRPFFTWFALDPVCLLKSSFFGKMNSRKVNFGKVNYFPMFGSIMKNKLENTFQCLVMSWKMSWKITY